MWFAQAQTEPPADPHLLNGAAASNGAVSDLPESLALQQLTDAGQEVQAPPSAPSPYRKDANDVLMLDGPEALRMLVEQAEIYPVEGLFE